MRCRLWTFVVAAAIGLQSRISYAGPQTIPPIGGPNLLVLLVLFCVVVAVIVLGLLAAIPTWLAIEVRKAKGSQTTGQTADEGIPFRRAVVEASLWFALCVFTAFAVLYWTFVPR